MQFSVLDYLVLKSVSFEEEASPVGGNPWAGEEAAVGEREREAAGEREGEVAGEREGEVADYFLNLTTKEEAQHTDRGQWK